ncbi:unnamed protein product, partial [Ectocarpus sp. 6 AP-2014]
FGDPLLRCVQKTATPNVDGRCCRDRVVCAGPRVEQQQQRRARAGALEAWRGGSRGGRRVAGGLSAGGVSAAAAAAGRFLLRGAVRRLGRDGGSERGRRPRRGVRKSWPAIFWFFPLSVLY